MQLQARLRPHQLLDAQAQPAGHALANAAPNCVEARVGNPAWSTQTSKQLTTRPEQPSSNIEGTLEGTLVMNRGMRTPERAYLLNLPNCSMTSTELWSAGQKAGGW